MAFESVLKKWHCLSSSEVAKFLNVDPTQGLSSSEVYQRQKEIGLNELPAAKKKTVFERFAAQFKSPLVYILIFAGVVSVLTGHQADSLVIFLVMMVNASVGFIQEGRASRVMESLEKAVKFEAKVLRFGSLKIIEAKHLVPGDVIYLEPGRRVPADARIIKSSNLTINEASLTGEWLPSEKQAAVIAPSVALAERSNMVFMSTMVESGKAEAIVVNTGEETEIGELAEAVISNEKKLTPFQKKLAEFSKKIGATVAVLVFLLLFIGLLRGFDFFDIFEMAVAVMVSSIPEGLPISLTVIMAVGMERLLKRKGLIKKMSATETLGRATVILLDKTGTITEGTMRVRQVISASEIFKNSGLNEDLVIKSAVLVGNAFLEDSQILRGEPMERAILEEALKRFGSSILDEKKKKAKEIEFNSQNKFSACLIEEQKGFSFHLYGAPERVISRCSFYQGGRILKLSERDTSKINRVIDEWALKGSRVLAVCQKDLKREPRNLLEAAEKMVFLGLIVISDPIRIDAKQAITDCRQMGIKPIIITGDHLLTAQSIAQEIGILKEQVLDCLNLDKMSDEELDKILESVSVFGRAEPRHKMRVAKAWQKRGEIVAMIGDGINDTPVLRQGDIGISLGSAEEAAQEASDLVLLDDSLSVVVGAVEEGRAILDNMRKVITYLLTDSFTEIILAAGTILFGLPLPVTAVQILWVNLIEDGLPGFALAFEPIEKDLKKQTPKRFNGSLVTHEMAFLIFVIGIITDFLLLGSFLYFQNYTGYSLERIRTIIFCGLAIDSLIFIFSCRSLRNNIWHANPFSNRFLNISVLAGFLLLFGAVYLPFLQGLLKTVSLSPSDWGIIFALGLVNLILIETGKAWFIKKNDV